MTEVAETAATRLQRSLELLRAEITAKAREHGMQEGVYRDMEAPELTRTLQSIQCDSIECTGAPWHPEGYGVRDYIGMWAPETAARLADVPDVELDAAWAELGVLGECVAAASHGATQALRFHLAVAPDPYK